VLAAEALRLTTGGFLDGLGNFVATLTLKLAVATFPAWSVAVTLMTVPALTEVPLAGVATTFVTDPSTVSLAHTVKVATPCDGWPFFAFDPLIVMVPGVRMTGFVASATLTVKLPAVTCPRESWDEQFTIVAPIGKTDPEANAELNETGSFPSTRSCAVGGAKVTTAPLAPSASNVGTVGSVRTGPAESLTVIVNDFVPVLPCASVFEQITVVTPNGNVLPEAWSGSAVVSAGTVTVGAVVSCTVTVKDLEPVFPCASVFEQMTVVTPNGNVLPEVWSGVAVPLPSTKSVHVGAEKLTAAPFAPLASAVTSAGTVTVGAVVSFTVTVNDLLPVFPCASVFEQTTVVMPNGNVLPEP
jgi:hypothetical protein